MTLLCVVLALTMVLPASIQTATARGEERALKLLNLHTNERAEIVFKRNGRYDQAGLRQINQILRDWRRNEPTTMDPKLMDLLWTAYQQTGSHEYINVVCGYRAPETNGALRRRSSGVAKNSLHMQGKAIDFFIPGVPLAKLRAIGLQMGYGGVGFYPTSGSPFVHMDTGSARHWPRMTRPQLVAVFPKGGTVHVPSDGKPLPGYAEAMADYKSRKAGNAFAYAANFRAVGGNGGGIGTLFARNDAPPPTEPTADAAPIQLASVVDDEAEDDAIAATIAGAPEPRRAVAVAEYQTAPTPMPRFAPRQTIIAEATDPTTVATAFVAPRLAPQITRFLAAMTEPDPQPAPAAVADLTPDFDFGPPQDWAPPTVPTALAQAMAERDQTRRGASLPIAPTAVVATIDMSRPLRAAAMTTAVLRRSDDAMPTMPRVMAYAAIDEAALPAPQPARATQRMTSAGVPMPLFNPRRQAALTGNAQPVQRRIAPAVVAHATVAPAMLTMTALDTVGLRQWIGTGSTRQKSYAVFTMPDFAQTPDLMQKPDMSYGAGFGQVAYAGLRTDRFSGPLVVQPDMVDLSANRIVASIR